ncbi:hypothetical protein [Acaryochloris sp. IP29b_bin.137]|uniref:hypothetical protein n=1 Tax=Acaryochloris sp. IP29b_bin.137 TaxID=2969217 RepID=UPI0026059C39|nr:hypothetical protein [Acaryochloris sp. IP29b_bin.137]
MNYLIAVLADRIQAEAAYTDLEKAGIPLAQLSLLGRGYKSADEFGFIDPKNPARKQARRLMNFSIPIGFICGATFELYTGVRLFPGMGSTVLNVVLGGLLGASFGAFGGLFSGGLAGLTAGSGDALVYRNRLNAGKYIVVVKGTEPLTRKATDILQRYDPENIQGYVEPPD